MIDTKSLEIINKPRLLLPITFRAIGYFEWNSFEPLYRTMWKRYVIMVEVIFDSKKYGNQYF
jgi:hypothetical protein